VLTNAQSVTRDYLLNETPANSANVCSPLTLRIVRGPLLPEENKTILSEYNKRIESPRIPIQEFLHWIQKCPEGPAWHAILESNLHGIVGHQCFIPLRANWRGHRFIAAKSEYTFLREDFQTIKILGFEGIKRPTHMVAAHQLVQRCQAGGWGPFLISTTPSLRRRGFYGFISTNFQLWECLLVLRPIFAARETQNIPRWQKWGLMVGGTVQRTAWWPAALLAARDTAFRSWPINGSPPATCLRSLSFFEDLESLRWRYPAGDYERLAINGEDSDYLIYKKGSASQYMRICQWSLDSSELSVSRIAGLIRVAQRDGAMGIRWAIYGLDEAAKTLVRRLRRFGFLCVSRARTLQIKSDEKEFLKPESWNLTDAMFSFHW
jgi:hypothetical protein